MSLVAGVDSSTQSCKVIIRDTQTGVVVRSGRAPHPEGTEVDPEAWWVALQKALAQAGGLADVAAISIGGQQHGMVLLDAEGRVIRDALLWNDTRSAGAAEDLIGEIGAHEYARRAGSVPVASFTATKLRWIRDNEPDNAQRVSAVALPHDWLTWRLRGYGPAPENPLGPDLDALTTDRSDASGTAYWSPSSNSYDLELFEQALGRPGRVAGTSGDGVILPLVLGPNESAGTTPEGTLVGPGAGDNAAAALGLGAGEGDVVVSIGTSGTVFAVTTTPSSDQSGTVAGFADASGLFLPLIATLNAARVLDALAVLLGVDHDGLAALAQNAEPGSAGAVLVPYFEGERTPNLPDAKASIHGLTLASTTRENLARAAIEGMLCGLADGLDALRQLAFTDTQSLERILLIGGAAQNPAVAEVASQVFDAPVTVPEPGEYVALGAAVQAAWVLTGVRPEWKVATSHHLPVDTRAVIRSQYARARS